MATAITDYKLEIRDLSNNVITSGTIIDSPSQTGVFTVSFTPTKAGSYLLYL